MVAFLPGLFLALACVVLLVYAFRSHERHWSLGFLGWRKVYTGLGIALAGSIGWAIGGWLATATANPGLGVALPIISGVLLAGGLGLVVSGSMERLRDLAEERRRLEEIRAGFDLYDTLREVVSGPYTFLEVLEFALKEMVRAAGVTTGGLWLYNPTGREWILTGAANMSQNFRRQVETVRGTGTGFDRLARLHKAHVFSRAEEIRLFFPEWEAEGIQSVLGLPLVTGTPGSSEKRLLGIIILADSSESRFDDDRARRLHAAADYVAAVIAEGRLQRQLESAAQQLEAQKAAQERELDAVREQVRAADRRMADERRAWETELNSRTGRLTMELDEARRKAAEDIARLESAAAAAAASHAQEVAVLRRDLGAQLDAARAAAQEARQTARHEVDVIVARLEELRRATDEEKRRMADEHQQQLSAERIRHDQAIAQIRALEASVHTLSRELEAEQRAREEERGTHARKLEAAEAQMARERQTLAVERRREAETLQARIGELETQIAAIEQEHNRQMSELRARADEERRAAVDEQRVLKQEIQSMRLTLADQQAHFDAERDNLRQELRQTESRYVQLLEAERDAHARAREEWEATHDAGEQLLLDLKLELENTRFEQGMALARAHNEAERIRDEYEERLSSLQDQVAMLEEALMAPPAGFSPEEEAAQAEAAALPAPVQDNGSKPHQRELHTALLEWVAQQDQDEWHLELSAHDTPTVDTLWLGERLDEARRTCRGRIIAESMGFAIKTLSRESGTVVQMTRLSAGFEEAEADGEEIPVEGNVARWLYDGDDRVGMQITLGVTAPVAAPEPMADDEEEVAEPVPGTLSVLVVEDQPEMQDVVTGMLASLGHEATVAAAAQEGYARYIGGHYDAVLISAELPQEEGFALVQWIKSHRAEMPVIMMADAGAREMAEPVDAVLVKPFAIEQLHECLLALTDDEFSQHVSVSEFDETGDE
ncbi:MAG TPA: response regulator [bacterium]|nr:response regulator [bacterium]